MNNKSVDEEELKLVDYQIIISVAVVVIAILSLILAYNLHLKLKKEKTLFTDEEVRNITIFVKFLAVLAGIAAIYISYKSISLAKQKGENLNNAYMEVAASILVLVSSIIVIIAIYRNNSDSLLNILNPEN